MMMAVLDLRTWLAIREEHKIVVKLDSTVERNEVLVQ